jgi:hypothetical protein
MPTAVGECTAGGREQDPVGCGEPGAAALAAQHPKLLPQDQDLQVLGAVIAVREDQQAGEHADDQPEHEDHRRMVRKRLLTTRIRVSAPHTLIVWRRQRRSGQAGRPGNLALSCDQS